MKHAGDEFLEKKRVLRMIGSFCIDHIKLQSQEKLMNQGRRARFKYMEVIAAKVLKNINKQIR